MADLLSQENVDQFRSAIRNITDTFHKSPVILRHVDEVGAIHELPLQAGVKSDDTGSYGEINGERYVQDEHTQIMERWIVTFNRDYLKEQGLVDPDTDKLLIDPEDWLIYQGKRYSIQLLADKAVFRGIPILVQLTAQR
jgi:hypothetical protein